MTRRILRQGWMAALMGLLAIGDDPAEGPGRAQAAQAGPTSSTSPADLAMAPLLRAAPVWDARQGPDRSVVDQVCLVPDLPTFLEAVGSWDRGHSFPVLFDDVESSFRFIRAFRPARIVRMPRSAAAPVTWERAVAAVGSSWKSEAGAVADRPVGDAPPKGMGPTPPGVVLSSPDAPMLAGAVALAAGRFQPILRLGAPGTFADVLSAEKVEALDRSIASAVGAKVPGYAGLGDDCDFLTVAADWPYRYRDASGELEAVDDRIGRVGGTDRRWAFAGRILGGPADSAYRAMCSLFLQPESALMFNGYDESARPWSDYSMRDASIRLSAAVPTSQVAGDPQANLGGWHETFDPLNRFGLVLINSHGSPTEFNIRGGPAHAPDIPRSVPSAVLMIHSFSAADPVDPSTIAGRWLANGAFVFFGSMNEPFLDAFRPSRLVADLIARRWPLVAAVRASPAEPRGRPWRLVFLGDPLYRIKAREPSARSPRLDRWGPTAGWPSYAEAPRPTDGADLDLFLWSLRTAMARQQGATADLGPGDDLVDALLAIRRDRLPTAYRPVLEALMTEVLLQARKKAALKARLAAIPEAERSPATRRTLETLLTIDFHQANARKDVPKAQAAWLDLMKTDAPTEFKRQATARVGRLADTPARRREWSAALQSALRDRPKPADLEIIGAERKRLAGLD